MSNRPLHVALLGSRGVPNRYGGYETLMEELATRLVRAGLRVTVYCRRHLTPEGLDEYNGARLAVLPNQVADRQPNQGAETKPWMKFAGLGMELAGSHL